MAINDSRQRTRAVTCITRFSRNFAAFVSAVSDFLSKNKKIYELFLSILSPEYICTYLIIIMGVKRKRYLSINRRRLKKSQPWRTPRSTVTVQQLSTNSMMMMMMNHQVAMTFYYSQLLFPMSRSERRAFVNSNSLLKNLWILQNFHSCNVRSTMSLYRRVDDAAAYR